jgi:hypothetical protein
MPLAGDTTHADAKQLGAGATAPQSSDGEHEKRVAQPTYVGFGLTRAAPSLSRTLAQLDATSATRLVLGLQSSVGNAQVQRLLPRSAAIQRQDQTPGTRVRIEPLPVSPAQAKLLEPSEDTAIAEELYGNTDVPITRLGVDTIKVQYSSLVPKWKPAFREAASPFETEAAGQTKTWNPIKDPLRGGMVIGFQRSSGGYTEVRNTDGEFMGADEIGLEPGIPIVGTALDLVEKGLKQVGYVLVGAVDTWLEDNWAALGLKPHERPLATALGLPDGAIAYQIGRGVGKLITLLQSAAEMVQGAALFVTGAGEFLAGLATTPEGIGFVIAPVGVVTMAGGAAIVVHGGALAMASVNHIGSGGGGGGRNPDADKIANGHAYDKHVSKQGEFPEVKDKKGFADLIDRVLKSPENKTLSNGRSAFWEDSTKTIVIKNPLDADGGTCFRPLAGKAYYLLLK